MKTEFKSALILGVVIIGGIAGISVIFSTFDSQEPGFTNNMGLDLVTQLIARHNLISSLHS